MQTDKELRKFLRENKEPLTPEALRTYSGFENYTDEEAQEIIFSLRSFAALVFDYVKEKQNREAKGETDNSDVPPFMRPPIPRTPQKVTKKRKKQSVSIPRILSTPQENSKSLDIESYQKLFLEEIQWQINNR